MSSAQTTHGPAAQSGERRRGEDRGEDRGGDAHPRGAERDSREPCALNLESPALRAALADIPLMQQWEVLRAAPRPLAVDEAASACRISPASAQEFLDRLVQLGLAVRLRATLREKRITYRSIAAEVIFAWDRRSEEQVRFVEDYREAMRAYSHELVERHAARGEHELNNRPQICLHSNMLATAEETSQILDALRALGKVIAEVERRGRIRAAARGRAGASGAADDEVEREADREFPLHVRAELVPLRHPEPATPHFSVWDVETLPKELEQRTRAPSAVLAPRELQIATRLARGESRPTIAAALGVSINTVATTTKRIYAKLGVRSRGAFVARMKDG